MKKKLLFLLMLGFGAAQVQAQTRPVLPAALEMPAALRQALGRHGAVPAPAIGRSSTVRKPGRTTVYAWDYPGNRWAEQARVELTTYDARGLRTQLVEQDSATQQPTERISWVYDAAGLETSQIEQKWDGTAWQNQARTQQSYNSFGSLTESLDQRWVNGAWQNSSRVTVAYDARNYYVAWDNQQWRNNAWVITYGGRATRIFNAAGAVLEETQENRFPDSEQYLPGARRRFGYPSPTALLYSEYIDQRWEPMTSVYVNERRVAVVRDAQGRETSSESESWVNGIWQLSFRTFTVFLPNGSMQGLSEERVNNAWVSTSRYIYSFDDWGNGLSSISEIWRNSAWSITDNSYRYQVRYNAANDLLGRVRQNYNPTTKAYDNALKYTYGDFQSITLGVKPNAVLAAQTQLYPNPTTGAATLELSGLANQPVPAEVVNSLGQVVQRLTLQPRQGQLRQSLELNQLPGGIYTVRLHTSIGLVVKKLLKK